MTIALRTATSNDADAVAAVYLASRKKFLPFAPLAHSDVNVRGWITEKLIQSGNMIVAEKDSEVIGMMATSTEDGVSWIDQLYISPVVVGQGTGTKLLNFAKDLLPPPICLYTFQQNAGARRFYERHGFLPISFSDGMDNEERCPDVLYEFSTK